MKKRMLCLLSLVCLLLPLAACGGGTQEKEPETMGEILLADFQTQVRKDPKAAPAALAERLLENPALPFEGMVTPVEPGLLTGFGNIEITGFQEGAMFGPMIGTIPFVGYVFRLEEGTNGDAFVQTLKDNGDLRWNICTEADQMLVQQEGDLVFFLMSPVTMEE